MVLPPIHRKGELSMHKQILSSLSAFSLLLRVRVEKELDA
jgi:hypothetical protein